MNRLKGFLLAVSFAAITGMLGGCAMSYTKYVYRDAEKYAPGDCEITDRIEDLDVDYLSGNVRLVSSDTNTASVKETSNVELDDRRKVHTWVDGTTLRVRFCASGKKLSFDGIEKSLVIEVPESVYMNTIKMACTSADISCEGIKTGSLGIDVTSGNITADCEAGDISVGATSGDITLAQKGKSESIRIETTSGDVKVDAETVSDMNIEVTSGVVSVEADDVKTLKSEATSGNGNFRFAKTPGSTDIHVTSGDIEITVPENADLTVDIDTASGDFSYDLPLSKNGNSYICGSGTNKLSIESTSGDIDLNVL